MKKAKTKVTTTTTTTVVTETVKEQKLTHVAVVLDRSGSMGYISKPTVEGLNSFINEQKAAKGEAVMTLVQFDNEYRLDYSAKPINEVVDLIDGETFKPGGTTALLDAIGKTITDLKDSTDDVIMVIITDGEENASREYTKDAINSMITDQKAKGWNFIFLGANIDAVSTAKSFGISGDSAMNYNANMDSVNMMYSSMSGKISSFRSIKSENSVNKNMKDTLTFNDEDRKSVDK